MRYWVTAPDDHSLRGPRGNSRHAVGDPGVDTDGYGQFFRPYGYGWRFLGSDNVQYHTVMAYDTGNAIPYFSSPLILHKGVAKRVAHAADNARLINETAGEIANYRQPAVYLIVKVKRAYESGLLPAKVGVTRTGDLSTDLTVTYTTGGTAQAGVNYVALPGQVTIPAGKISAKIIINPIVDNTHTGRLKLSLTGQPGTTYVVEDSATANAVIIDAD